MDVYLRVRRAVMVEGISIREAVRVFGLHRDTVPNYAGGPPFRRPVAHFAAALDTLSRPSLETTENSVNLAHLRYVHGCDSVNGAQPVSVDDPCLESHFDFTSTRTIAKVATFAF